MSTVATDRLTGETVALKQVILSPPQLNFDSQSQSQTESDLRLALAQEFQILAGLRHPHIVSVLDYGFNEECQPFFTMTYLPEAQTILAAGERQTTERKLELIQQLLQAIAYLHRRGILHRDLKPQNILVSNDLVRVLDFGLASGDRFQSHSSAGTPFYTAPELWDGLLHSEAADLFAIGVMAYELFAGKHPFAPYDIYFLDRLMDSEPELDTLGLTENVAQIIGTLLAKTPQQRFATAEAALSDLAIALGQRLPQETAAIRESYLQAAKFVGRKEEVATLTTALTRAKAGSEEIWLIGGESGVGKSRLLEEVRSRALVSGWQVITGQTIAEGSISYQLWADILPRLVLDTELSDLEAGVLQQVVPTIGRLLRRDIPEPPELRGAAALQRLVQTLLSVLQQQKQPTLLLLEDLHWARESLILLKQVLKGIHKVSDVMIIGTYRHDECPDLPSELTEAQTLILGRLNEAQIAELSEAILGKRGKNLPIVSLLTRETEGNTLFIVEVMRALAEEAGQLDQINALALPKDVFTQNMKQLLQRRIQKVPQPDQTLLQLAATVGRQLDMQLLKVLAPDKEIDHCCNG